MFTYIVEKPWGHEKIWVEKPFYTSKFLYIKQGCRLSLQKHERKHESFFILSGSVRLHVRGVERIMVPGDTVSICPGEIHRLEAVVDAEVLEVSTTEIGDHDIVRIEDDYGRA